MYGNKYGNNEGSPTSGFFAERNKSYLCDLHFWHPMKRCCTYWQPCFSALISRVSRPKNKVENVLYKHNWSISCSFFHSVWWWIPSFAASHKKPSGFATIPESYTLSQEPQKRQDPVTQPPSTNHHRERSAWIWLYLAGHPSVLRWYKLLQGPPPCVGQ